MGSVSGGGTYEYGSQVTLTATPNNGYHFVNWSNGSEENPYTFTVFGDVALIAQFARNIGIGDVDGNKYVLHVTGRELRVGNAERQALLICDIVGRTIYATDNYDGRKVVLPTSGVYLLCIGKNTLQRILVH